MTSWAKNQIAKQLARFVKNLDPSQISLKFLKGEGELTNLQLNEQVLTDLLELPPWLQLRKATCNRICAKIHWTSLKTDPIKLFLDCVEVEILASEVARETPPPKTHIQGRQPSKEKHVPPKASKYGFAEKVVDGMYVSINSVLVSFKAPGFKATFSMSRLTIQSTDPDWNLVDNLRKTRIKDEQRGQVLIFKEIKWVTMRLDADASYADSAQGGSIPIRLITNNSAIRLTIKKRLNDCSLVSSRLEIILDDILWILTQSQLLKLSSFVHFLLKIRQKFLPMATHSEAPKDHAPAGGTTATTQRRSSSQYQGHGQGLSLNKHFTEHDVEETSYHLKTNRIDLHLCDDQTLQGTGFQKQQSMQSNDAGALMISISNFRLDHYPYHIAGLRRKVNRNDDDALFSRRQWAQQLFDFFLKNEGKQISQMASQQSRNSQHYRRPLMYESFFLISCTKFVIMEVSTNDKQDTKPFLSSDKEALFLPEDMNAFLLDFTSYYFIGYSNLPVPPSNMFLKVNPVKLTFHPLTCIWLNKFIQSVVAGLEWTKEFMAKETGPPEHLDIRIEALMPQVTMPCATEPTLPHQEDRPKALQIQVSQAVVSNSRIGVATSQSDLLMDVQNALASKLYPKNSLFPNEANDYGPLPNEFWVNDYSMVHRRFCSAFNREAAASREQNDLYRERAATTPVDLSRERTSQNGPTDGRGRSVSQARFNDDPRLIWCIWCEQIWVDFVGIEKSYSRPVTLIDAVPIRFWLSLPIVIPKPSNVINLNPNASNAESPQYNEDATQRTREGTAGRRLLEPPRKHHVKTGSTASLPATMTLSQLAASVSSADSDSSLSIESSNSNTLDFEDGLVKIGRSHQTIPSESRHKPDLRRMMTSSSPEEFADHPLRTSYSETDLMPTTHSSPQQGDDTTSLQDFGEGTGPPPPYSPSSSSHLGTRALSPQSGSSESLPPQYSQLPAYDTLVNTGGATSQDEQAPPLPTKVTDDISNFFTSESETNTQKSTDQAKKIPTIGSILQVAKPTNLQLDHFQLVFLLRLQEMLADVAEKVSQDTLQFQTLTSPVHKEVTKGGSFSLHLTVPSVDINFVLPPSNGVHDEQLMSLEDRIKAKKLTRFIDLIKLAESNSDIGNDIASSHNEKSVTGGRSENGSVNRDNFKTVSTSDLQTSSDSELSVNSKVETASSTSSDHNSRQMTSPAKSDSHCEANAVRNESGPNERGAATINSPESKGHNLKPGLSEHVTSDIEDSSGISSATDSPPSSARDSIASDPLKDAVEQTNHFDTPSNPADHVTLSDDNADERDDDIEENEAELLEMCESEARLRTVLRNVEMSEIGTQTDAEPPVAPTYDTYKDQQVSILCLKCKDIRLGIQSENPNTVVKVAIGTVKLEDKGHTTYAMTLDHRLSNARRDSDKEQDISLLDSKPQVAVRMLSGPVAEEFAEGGAEMGFAHVKVKGLEASLLLSNAENLGEFVEDEYLLKKMPVMIELENLGMQLLDDKPRKYLASPLPPPMEICIERLCVLMSTNGKISIANRTENEQECPCNCRHGSLRNTLTSSDQYEASLLTNGTGDTRPRTADQLNDSAAENERLIDDMKLANARLVSLEQERDAILKVVEKLQQELMWSNHENEKLLDKVRNYRTYVKSLGKG